MTDDWLHLRLVLRESKIAAIYEHARDVSNPKSSKYGQFATREQLRQWGNPRGDQRERVLALFKHLQVNEVSVSPLIFVSAKKSELEGFFRSGVLDPLNQINAGPLEIPSWEWAGKLSALEAAIRSIHVVDYAPGTAAERAQARPLHRYYGESAPPIRGWMHPHVGQFRATENEKKAVPRLLRHRQAAPAPAGLPSPKSGATPDVIRKIYNFPPGITGSGETIAVLALGSSDPETRALITADLTTFWTHFGVDREPVRHVPVGPASSSPHSDPLFRLEATMAPAWIGILAPKATIVVYEMALDLPDPWLAAVEQAVADDEFQPTILCITWTMPEEFYYRQFERASISLALAKAAAAGITVVVSAGDWGVYDGRPGTLLASDPVGKVARSAWPHATFPSCEERVLSVGGTMLNAWDTETEVGWSGPLPPDSALAQELSFTSLATSGGFSQRIPIPDWQRDAVLGQSRQRSYSRGSNLPAVLPYGRGYPDVALMAAGLSLARGVPPGLSASGYQLVIDNVWINYAGGTSLAAPIWACAIALCNEHRRGESSPEPRLGFANRELYFLGLTRPISGENAVLRLIEGGNSDVEFRIVTSSGKTSQYVLAGYHAQSRWDPVTGLGVPNVENLAAALYEFATMARKQRAERDHSSLRAGAATLGISKSPRLTARSQGWARRALRGWKGRARLGRNQAEPERRSLEHKV